LLEHGSIEVRGVISADEAVVNFGKINGINTLHIKNKVRYLASKREIEEFLSTSSFDYFFSIINAMFLPDEIIQLSKKLAINFHDSELPKYAGIDATSWAIMRGEPQHAVTWHVMTGGIDEGDIVKQVYVPIEMHETAFTLNNKCLDAGFASFKELLDDLLRDKITYRGQRADQKSYYSRSKPHLPEMAIWNHGVVSWHQSATEIATLTRALDYGLSRNSLGSAKIFIEGDFYILPSVIICDGLSELAPGTVVDNDGNSLVISTSSLNVSVREVLTIDGCPISIAALSSKHDISEGAKLGAAPPELLRAVKELDKDIMWKEAYWASAFDDYVRVPLRVKASSDLDKRPSGAADQTNEAACVLMSDNAKEGMRRFAKDNGLDLRTLLFCGFSSFLARLVHSDVVPIWYSDEGYRQDVTGMTKLVSPFALCRTRFDGAWTAFEHYRHIEKQLHDVKMQGHFLYDILYRYPQLRNGRGFEPLRQFLFVSHGARDQRDDRPMAKAAFEISLEVIGSPRDLLLFVNCACGTLENTRWLAEQFSLHVERYISYLDISRAATS
jgi:methionyl-tRNA formyltransferase